MSTDYFNPTTGRWESPEEMGERPATADTVLPSEAIWESVKASLPPGGMVIGSTGTARNPFYSLLYGWKRPPLPSIKDWVPPPAPAAPPR